jgi:hypothetical protein
LGETRSVSKEISPKEKEAWEHFSLDYISKKTVSHFPFPISHFPFPISRFPDASITKPFSGPKSEKTKKEPIRKSKRRRKNMPRKKRARKTVFWRKEKEILLYKNQKITN